MRRRGDNCKKREREGMSGMELHEVLARIRPCDTEKPYVFVS